MIETNTLYKYSSIQYSELIRLLNRAEGKTTLPATPLFGTDGIRGCVGVDKLLNSSLAWQIGFWAGQTFRMQKSRLSPVILGQDSRNSSNMLSKALTKGLTAAGIEVWNLGLCPTPAVAHLTKTYQTMGGIMISASHNPPEDNGIKFFNSDGNKLSSLVQAQIEAGIRGKWLQVDVAYNLELGKRRDRSDLISQYIESVCKPFESIDLTGMKIVLDLAWGAAVDTAPAIFKAMGAEVISLHECANGDRINVNCGSTHLASLQQAVIQHQGDLGFAFDGDADRVMAVDSRGQVVDGDYILYFCGLALRQQQMLPDNTIVSTVMANLGFENAWVKSGGKLIRTAVGDRYVHDKMVELGAALGGEQSGHILCPHYGVSGDGVLTALHLATLVKRQGKSLEQMLADSFVKYPQLLVNVRVEDPQRRQNWQECKPLVRAIAEAETAMGTQGRVLVRPSGTEPLIRVMVEAENMELARYWSDILVTHAEKYLAS